MVKIAHEVPKQLFPMHDFINDYCFVLAHLLLEETHHYDELYAGYYKNKLANSKFSILDNACLDYYSNILLADGTTEKLGVIIKNKLNVEVLSYNKKTNQLEPKKVVNWFDNGTKKTDWYKIIYKNSKVNKKSRVGLRCTGDHKIWTKKNEYVLARNLKVGDKICTNELCLTDAQKQLILGTILGDSSIFKSSKTARPFLKCGHSDKQKDYVEFKEKILKNISQGISCRSNEKGLNKRKGALLYTLVTKRLMQFEEIYSQLYKENNLKNYSNIISQLNWFGFCVWYLDDGSTNQTNNSPVVNISLAPLSKEDEINIPILLKKYFDLESKITHYENNNIILSFSVVSSKKIFNNIQEFVPESMMYKIHPNCIIDKALNKDYLFKIAQDISEVEIEKIIPLNYYKKTKYDITVEDNHNYFADGILVSNCFELGDSIDYKRLYELGEEYKPTHIILPDCLNEAQITKDRAIQYINEFGNKSTPKFIGVLQGRNYNEIRDLLYFFHNNPLIDIIALPFSIMGKNVPEGADWKLWRVTVFRELIYPTLKGLKSTKKIHLLGCHTPLEFAHYLPHEIERIWSIDTSAPIIYGWNNVNFEDITLDTPKPKDKLAECLDKVLSVENIDCIAKNVKIFRNYMF